MMSRTWKILIALFTFLFVSSILISFFEKGNGEFSNFFDSIWWAIVTITTVGYGDKVPSTLAGRIVAVATMSFGMILVGVIVGEFASSFFESRLLSLRGFGRLSKMKNQILICGYRSDLREVVVSLLELVPNRKVSDIVLVNNAGEDKLMDIFTDRRFHGINYIKGDYAEEDVLEKANVRTASSALVITEIEGAQNLSEADSKVLACVLMLKSLNPRIHVTAEVVSGKYKNYLEKAKCDEIILTQEYEKALLTCSTVFPGITKVIHKLLGIEGSKEKLRIFETPSGLVGKTFSDAFALLRNQKEILLIGIIENTGGVIEYKEKAIKRAQGAPDLSTLLHNLQGVKTIERNKPVINPPNDYVLKEDCYLVGIE